MTWFRAVSPLVFGVVSTVILLIPAFLLLGITGDLTSKEFLIITALQFLLLGVGTFVFIVIASKWDKFSYDYFEVIHWKNISINHIKWIGICITGLLVTNFTFGFIFTYLNLDVAENAVLGVAESNPIYLLYLIPIMLFFVGPAEELLFRGVLQGVLRDAFNTKISIFITSLLFGFIHTSAAGGFSNEAMLYILTTFMLGIILGYIYELKESLIIPIVAHGIYNSILVIVAYYQMTAI